MAPGLDHGMNEWGMVASTFIALATGIGAELVLSKSKLPPLWRLIVAVPVPWVAVLFVWSVLGTRT